MIQLRNSSQDQMFLYSSSMKEAVQIKKPQLSAWAIYVGRSHPALTASLSKPAPTDFSGKILFVSSMQNQALTLFKKNISNST